MREESITQLALTGAATVEEEAIQPSPDDAPSFRQYLDATFARRLIEHMHRAKVKAIGERE